jgi:hypothetical protein
MNKLNVWRVIAVVSLIVIVVVVLRLGTSKPGKSITTSGGNVAATKFSCSGPHGELRGNCASGLWDHAWNDLSYCSDLKAVCEAGGGTFKEL